MWNVKHTECGTGLSRDGLQDAFDGRGTALSIRTQYGSAPRPAITPPVAPVRRAKARASSGWSVFVFLAPWGIGITTWYLYPIVMTAYYGLTNFDGVHSPKWVGLNNFETIFSADPRFWTAVENTAWWVFINVPLSIAVSFALAMILVAPVRGVGIARTLIYLPSMIPVAGSGLLFLWLLNPTGGVVNNISSAVGGPTPGWFTDPAWSKPALLLLSLWSVGGMMIIFLLGLQQIPRDLYEAATIDGAGFWQRTWHVTLPGSIQPAFFNLILGLVAAFTYFGAPLIASSAPTALGGGGGGVNAAGIVGNPVDSTLTVSVYIYEQLFTEFRFGYASALSVILALVVVATGGLLFIVGRKLAPESGQ